MTVLFYAAAALAFLGVLLVILGRRRNHSAPKRRLKTRIEYEGDEGTFGGRWDRYKVVYDAETGEVISRELLGTEIVGGR